MVGKKPIFSKFFIYIFSSIESGRNFPTMQDFFYICEYLKITPSEFFSFNINNPIEFDTMIKNLSKLKARDITSLANIIDTMVN